MEKIIIGVAGQIASGKDTLSNYAIEKYKAKQLKFSKVLRDILQRIYKENTRENMQTLSTLLRQYFGDDLLANVIYNDIKNASEDIIIVDGVRRLPDIEMLKTLGFKLLFIEATPEVRYERLIQRSENIDDRNKTFEEFQKESMAETEVRIADLKNVSDYVIDNNGTLDELYRKIDEIITELKK